MPILTFGISSSVICVVESCVEDGDLDFVVKLASASLCNAFSMRVPQLNKDLALSVKKKKIKTHYQKRRGINRIFTDINISRICFKH